MPKAMGKTALLSEPTMLKESERVDFPSIKGVSLTQKQLPAQLKACMKQKKLRITLLHLERQEAGKTTNARTLCIVSINDSLITRLLSFNIALLM